MCGEVDAGWARGGLEEERVKVFEAADTFESSPCLIPIVLHPRACIDEEHVHSGRTSSSPKADSTPDARNLKRQAVGPLKMPPGVSLH